MFPNFWLVLYIKHMVCPYCCCYHLLLPFHLSLCLSPTPPGVGHLPHYPQCIYTCVRCLSVASSSCLIRSYQRVFPSPCVLKFCFLVSPVLTILPALTPSLPAVLYLSDSDPFTKLCLSCTWLTLPWIADLWLPLIYILPCLLFGSINICDSSCLHLVLILSSDRCIAHWETTIGNQM